MYVIVRVGFIYNFQILHIKTIKKSWSSGYFNAYMLEWYDLNSRTPGKLREFPNSD